MSRNLLLIELEIAEGKRAGQSAAIQDVGSVALNLYGDPLMLERGGDMDHFPEETVLTSMNF